MQKRFVGHVRFDSKGAPEFATGWNEAEAPRTISAEHSKAGQLRRGWFDAYATSSAAKPLAIQACGCGVKPPFRRR